MRMNVHAPRSREPRGDLVAVIIFVSNSERNGRRHVVFIRQSFTRLGDSEREIQYDPVKPHPAFKTMMERIPSHCVVLLKTPIIVIVIFIYKVIFKVFNVIVSGMSRCHYTDLYSCSFVKSSSFFRSIIV